MIPLGTTKDLARIGAWVEACCAEWGIKGKTVFRIALAVDEACANIFVHGYAGQPGPVHLAAAGSAGALTISIRDWGTAFNPRAVSFPNPINTIEERAVGGLGLFLIHKVMDDVIYESETGNGNVLHLTKRV